MIDENHQHVFEAIAHDAKSLLTLIHTINKQPSKAILFLGILPPLSMFVIESYRAIKLTNTSNELMNKLQELLMPLRHQAKLMGSAEKTVDHVLVDLTKIAERQKQLFLGLHTGFLGSLKRAIQPDLGLYTCNGHIFSTTHTVAYSLGNVHDPEEKASNIGMVIGSYTAAINAQFGFHSANTGASPITFSDTIEMRDIKSQALYKRGPLGKTPTEVAVGITYLLANLNYMRLVIQRFLPIGGLSQFRLKFITAYHADSNLRSIQNQLVSVSSLDKEASGIFKDILGNPDSRWLRKRTSLRNLLVHYMLNEPVASSLPPALNRVQAIEHFGGERDYTEMDALLDRHIERMAIALEKGFLLDGDPFWYGRVI